MKPLPLAKGFLLKEIERDLITPDSTRGDKGVVTIAIDT
jgi:hypothetical protein